MDASIPSLGSSAQAAVTRGFDQLDQAAAQITRATLATQDKDADTAGAAASDSASVSAGFTGPPPSDELVAGIMNTIQGEMQATVGITLLHVYQRTTDQLASLLTPEPRR